jgi:hypothetical protein
MNALNLMLFLLIVIFIVSCATPQSFPTVSDYLQGYIIGGEFAKEDAMNSTCDRHPRYAEQKAREYAKRFQDQSRSEKFIKGLYDGYEISFPEYINLYCGP